MYILLIKQKLEEEEEKEEWYISPEIEMILLIFWIIYIKLNYKNFDVNLYTGKRNDN